METDPALRWMPPATEPAARSAPPPPRRRTGLRRVFGPIAAVLVAIANWAAKLKGLLLLLPKLKLLATAGSMGVSVAAYALLWGPAFAVGFVALLFVHEMGHVVQMRREGVRPSWMVFVPFMGAAVGARSLGANALAEARVGLAGPVVGTLGSGLVALVGVLTGSDFWYALAFIGFFLNLFNLIPVVPLDGGRAMAAMSPWMWLVGFATVVVLAFIRPNPVLILIAVLGGMELLRRWRDRGSAYYSVRPAHRVLVGLVYFGLIATLAVGMDLTYIARTL
jgi:Zn-dependent protease